MTIMHTTGGTKVLPITKWPASWSRGFKPRCCKMKIPLMQLVQLL